MHIPNSLLSISKKESEITLEDTDSLHLLYLRRMYVCLYQHTFDISFQPNRYAPLVRIVIFVHV